MKNTSIENHAMSPDQWLDAGDVIPSKTRYVVTWPHGHKHLNIGDIVVLVETPQDFNCLLRVADMTLHDAQDQAGQYVHIAEVKPSPARSP